MEQKEEKQLKLDKETIDNAIRNRDVKLLARFYFDIKLTPIQCEIVRGVAFQEHKRFSISACTQYGKSLSIAIAVALYFILNEDKQVYFLSPSEQQSMILRDYLAKLIQKCPTLLEITDLTLSREERLTQKGSRSFQTFKNGNSYRVLTCHDTAENLMGHGISNGIVIVDEACLIGNDAYVKIMRMLTSNPEGCMLVELYNPWKMNCRAFEHSINPSYHKIQVSWQTAVKEGRTTKQFVMEQKQELSKLDFCVLYDSKFPTESDNALFNLDKIQRAEKREIRKTSTIIISLDPAEKGSDFSCWMILYKNDYEYFLHDIYKEQKSELMDLVGKIHKIIKDNITTKNIIVNIDCIGIGSGIVSRLKEIASQININYPKHDKITINACHFGERAIIEPDGFANKKAENFWRLRCLFDENLISIPHNKDLMQQLLETEFKRTSTNKIIIVDEGKLTDHVCALVYGVWFVEPEINWTPTLV